jgi:hypothetical protein
VQVLTHRRATFPQREFLVFAERLGE